MGSEGQEVKHAVVKRLSPDGNHREDNTRGNGEWWMFVTGWDQRST